MPNYNNVKSKGKGPKYDNAKPIKNTLGGGGNTVFKGKFSDYSGYGDVYDDKFKGKRRAENQSTGEQLAITGAKLIPNILNGIVESVGYLGEAPETINHYATGGNTDFSNPLIRFSEAMSNKLDSGIGEVYTEGDMFSADSGNILNITSGLLESIASFYALGAGTAKVFGTGAKLTSKGISSLSRTARATQMGEYLSSIGVDVLKASNAASKAAYGGAKTATAMSMAYTEGMMSAAQVYKDTLNFQVGNGLSEEEAKTKATEAGIRTMEINTILNTALNFTSISPFFGRRAGMSKLSKAADDQIARINRARSKNGLANLTKEEAKAYRKELIGLTRNNSNKIESIADLPKDLEVAKKSILKTIGVESLQEGVEELVNVYAEKSGSELGTRGKKSSLWEDLLDLDNMYKTAATPEGLMAFALGAIGGAGQTAITSGLVKGKGFETVEKSRISAYKERLNSDPEFKASQEDLAKQNNTTLDAKLEEMSKDPEWNAVELYRKDDGASISTIRAAELEEEYDLRKAKIDLMNDIKLIDDSVTKLQDLDGHSVSNKIEREMIEDKMFVDVHLMKSIKNGHSNELKEYLNEFLNDDTLNRPVREKIREEMESLMKEELQTPEVNRRLDELQDQLYGIDELEQVKGKPLTNADMKGFDESHTDHYVEKAIKAVELATKGEAKYENLTELYDDGTSASKDYVDDLWRLEMNIEAVNDIIKKNKPAQQDLDYVYPSLEINLSTDWSDPAKLDDNLKALLDITDEQLANITGLDEIRARQVKLQADGSTENLGVFNRLKEIIEPQIVAKDITDPIVKRVNDYESAVEIRDILKASAKNLRSSRGRKNYKDSHNKRMSEQLNQLSRDEKKSEARAKQKKVIVNPNPTKEERVEANNSTGTELDSEVGNVNEGTNENPVITEVNETPTLDDQGLTEEDYYNTIEDGQPVKKLKEAVSEAEYNRRWKAAYDKSINSKALKSSGQFGDQASREAQANRSAKKAVSKLRIVKNITEVPVPPQSVETKPTETGGKDTGGVEVKPTSKEVPTPAPEINESTEGMAQTGIDQEKIAISESESAYAELFGESTPNYKDKAEVLADAYNARRNKLGQYYAPSMRLEDINVTRALLLNAKEGDLVGWIYQPEGGKPMVVYGTLMYFNATKKKAILAVKGRDSESASIIAKDIDDIAYFRSYSAQFQSNEDAIDPEDPSLDDARSHLDAVSEKYFTKDGYKNFDSISLGKDSNVGMGIIQAIPEGAVITLKYTSGNISKTTMGVLLRKLPGGLEVLVNTADGGSEVKLFAYTSSLGVLMEKGTGMSDMLAPLATKHYDNGAKDFANIGQKIKGFPRWASIKVSEMLPKHKKNLISNALKVNQKVLVSVKGLTSPVIASNYRGVTVVGKTKDGVFFTQSVAYKDIEYINMEGNLDSISTLNKGRESSLFSGQYSIRDQGKFDYENMVNANVGDIVRIKTDKGVYTSAILSKYINDMGEIVFNTIQATSKKKGIIIERVMDTEGNITRETKDSILDDELIFVGHSMVTNPSIRESVANDYNRIRNLANAAFEKVGTLYDGTEFNVLKNGLNSKGYKQYLFKDGDPKGNLVTHLRRGDGIIVEQQGKKILLPVWNIVNGYVHFGTVDPDAAKAEGGLNSRVKDAKDDLDRAIAEQVLPEEVKLSNLPVGHSSIVGVAVSYPTQMNNLDGKSIKSIMASQMKEVKESDIGKARKDKADFKSPNDHDNSGLMLLDTMNSIIAGYSPFEATLPYLNRFDNYMSNLTPNELDQHYFELETDNKLYEEYYGTVKDNYILVKVMKDGKPVIKDGKLLLHPIYNPGYKKLNEQTTKVIEQLMKDKANGKATRISMITGDTKVNRARRIISTEDGYFINHNLSGERVFVKVSVVEDSKGIKTLVADKTDDGQLVTTTKLPNRTKSPIDEVVDNFDINKAFLPAWTTEEDQSLYVDPESQTTGKYGTVLYPIGGYRFAEAIPTKISELNPDIKDKVKASIFENTLLALEESEASKKFNIILEEISLFINADSPTNISKSANPGQYAMIFSPKKGTVRLGDKGKIYSLDNLKDDKDYFMKWLDDVYFHVNKGLFNSKATNVKLALPNSAPFYVIDDYRAFVLGQGDYSSFSPNPIASFSLKPKSDNLEGFVGSNNQISFRAMIDVVGFESNKEKGVSQDNIVEPTPDPNPKPILEIIPEGKPTINIDPAESDTSTSITGADIIADEFDDIDSKETEFKGEDTPKEGYDSGSIEDELGDFQFSKVHGTVNKKLSLSNEISVAKQMISGFDIKSAREEAFNSLNGTVADFMKTLSKEQRESFRELRKRGGVITRCD